MAFKPGESGNIKGRSKGVKNKSTVEWEEFGKKFIEIGCIRMLEIMQNSTDEEFSKNFIAIIEYFKPKLARVEHENTQNLTVINYTLGTDGKTTKSVELPTRLLND